MATQAEGRIEGFKQREEALCVLWTALLQSLGGRLRMA
jgi:hypothetical protein